MHCKRVSVETSTGIIKWKDMFAKGDLFPPPSTHVNTGRGPGRRELLGYIMVISPCGDQRLPPESVSATVSPARAVGSPVFLSVCEQLRTLVRYLQQIWLLVKNQRCFAPLPPELRW